MLLETWLLYVVAVTIVLVIPGPTILLVISQVLQHGKRSATPLVAGVALGDFVAMVLSLAGLGVVLSTSAQLFLLIKWVGAVYLVYLGWSLWRKDAKARLKRVSGVSENSRILFRQAFLVTVLNPKGIVFFLAFLPQFVNPDGDRWLQLAILGLTFVVLGALNALLYALAAAHVETWIRTPRANQLFNRAGGSALMGAGVLTAATDR